LRGQLLYPDSRAPNRLFPALDSRELLLEAGNAARPPGASDASASCDWLRSFSQLPRPRVEQDFRRAQELLPGHGHTSPEAPVRVPSPTLVKQTTRRGILFFFFQKMGSFPPKKFEMEGSPFCAKATGWTQEVSMADAAAPREGRPGVAYVTPELLRRCARPALGQGDDAGLASVTEIDFRGRKSAGTHTIRVLEGLDRCPKVRSINASGNEIVKLEGLKDVSKSLQELYLAHNRVSLRSATLVLPQFAGLRVLDLSHNSLTRIPPASVWEKLQSLQSLSLSHNALARIADVSRLSACKSLGVLSLLAGNPFESQPHARPFTVYVLPMVGELDDVEIEDAERAVATDRFGAMSRIEELQRELTRAEEAVGERGDSAVALQRSLDVERQRNDRLEEENSNLRRERDSLAEERGIQREMLDAQSSEFNRVAQQLLQLQQDTEFGRIDGALLASGMTTSDTVIGDLPQVARSLFSEQPEAQLIAHSPAVWSRMSLQEPQLEKSRKKSDGRLEEAMRQQVEELGKLEAALKEEDAVFRKVHDNHVGSLIDAAWEDAEAASASLEKWQKAIEEVEQEHANGIHPPEAATEIRRVIAEVKNSRNRTCAIQAEKIREACDVAEMLAGLLETRVDHLQRSFSRASDTLQLVHPRLDDVFRRLVTFFERRVRNAADLAMHERRMQMRLLSALDSIVGTHTEQIAEEPNVRSREDVGNRDLTDATLSVLERIAAEGGRFRAEVTESPGAFAIPEFCRHATTEFKVAYDSMVQAESAVEDAVRRQQDIATCELVGQIEADTSDTVTEAVDQAIQQRDADHAAEFARLSNDLEGRTSDMAGAMKETSGMLKQYETEVSMSRKVAGHFGLSFAVL
jgi:Leucine-rich repeat